MIVHRKSPRAGAEPEDQTHKAVKRRLLVSSAVGFFCLTLLFAWLGIGPPKASHPSSPSEWVMIIVTALVETAIFTALFYWTSTYLLDHLLFKDHRRGEHSQGK